MRGRKRDKEEGIFGFAGWGKSRWPSIVPTCWWVWVDQLCTRGCVFSCVCVYMGQQGYASSISVLSQMVPERWVDSRYHVYRLPGQQRDSPKRYIKYQVNTDLFKINATERIWYVTTELYKSIWCKSIQICIKAYDTGVLKYCIQY